MLCTALRYLTLLSLHPPAAPLRRCNLQAASTSSAPVHSGSPFACCLDAPPVVNSQEEQASCAPSYTASPTTSTSCLGAYVSFLCESALLISLSCASHLAQPSRELSASPVWSTFRMRSVSYLRTTLPAAATLPDAHTHLPLDLAAILNS